MCNRCIDLPNFASPNGPPCPELGGYVLPNRPSQLDLGEAAKQPPHNPIRNGGELGAHTPHVLGRGLFGDAKLNWGGDSRPRMYRVLRGGSH